jgi:hypothetical protein
MSIVTTLEPDVYHLLSTCHVHIKVRKKFLSLDCLLLFPLNSFAHFYLCCVSSHKCLKRYKPMQLTIKVQTCFKQTHQCFLVAGKDVLINTKTHTHTHTQIHRLSGSKQKYCWHSTSLHLFLCVQIKCTCEHRSMKATKWKISMI